MPRGRKPRSAVPPEANRREELLHAAARLFVEKGFDATTTRDIAQAVGMRSGSPFYHFRSKQDLLKAAIADGLETGYRRLQAAVEGIDDAEQRLRIMIRTHLGNLLEGECQAPMLLYETRSLDAAARAEIATITDRYQKPWQSTLDALALSGRLRGSAPPVRLYIFGMLNWSTQWYRPDGALSIDQLSECAIDMLLEPGQKTHE
ncbi:MAG: TetR family transcriptional regulator [Propionivibrio sp.]|uniref:TetR family transcriptional regulator n=1 Tax=Candidatus Propionivibrio dominans TaxID=2954373 RepID=A0A9D7I7E4_9RHOO|nr:TetR family transcriptional regulator [Candidatus Propionivibrio dominans]MBL0167690.1 TetR family transcriptional regulator [Propionivibrio sp.]